jgi:hypothetical protein
MRRHWSRRSLAIALPAAGLVAVASLGRAQPSLSELDLRVTEADFAPQVRLRDYENRTVEEFSVNGNVYMVRIQPAAGAPYYLVDTDGSGDMEWNRGGPGFDTQVPQWALISW